MVVLAAHGATYLTLKTEGPVHDRCAKSAKCLWAAVIPLFVAISIESWNVRPSLAQDAIERPFCWIGLLFILVATYALVSGLSKRLEKRAFVGSNLFLVGVLATGSAAFFPVMLYSTLAPGNSLTAQSVSAGSESLLLASFWWPISFALATSYFVFISRRYAGKVSVVRDNQGYY
jgi:cytochrome d ubiquinol oxidase subunit II